MGVGRMTNIKLKASDPLHRDIARLFVGQWVGYECISPMQGKLVGVFINSMNLTRFSVGSVFLKKITIDLDSTPMDLRMALNTGIKFEVYADGGEDGDFYCRSDRLSAVDNEGQIEIQSEWVNPDEIKLSLPWLKSKGIEVIE